MGAGISRLFGRRIFFISTIYSIRLDHDFRRMLDVAGVSVVCNTEGHDVIPLLEQAIEGDDEIVGCASFNNLKLVKKVVGNGGVVLATGVVVERWCAQTSNVEPDGWHRCFNVIDGRSFLRLQIAIAGH